MKSINILSQKTTILDDDQSKNSIRPTIEEAWFWMEYNDVRKTLTILDWKEKIAQIVWVKWRSDFQNLSRYLRIFWLWSDLAEEIFSNRDAISKVLQTWIWSCSLEYILQWRDLSNSFKWICDSSMIYTKSPNYLSKILREYYREFITDRLDAPEFSPEEQELVDFSRILESKISYSDSPDTLISKLEKLGQKASWWEIVETGNSIEGLWLKRCTKWSLTRQVSTDIYANEYLDKDSSVVLDYFLWKIKQALDLK